MSYLVLLVVFVLNFTSFSLTYLAIVRQRLPTIAGFILRRTTGHLQYSPASRRLANTSSALCPAPPLVPPTPLLTEAVLVVCCWTFLLAARRALPTAEALLAFTSLPMEMDSSSSLVLGCPRCMHA